MPTHRRSSPPRIGSTTRCWPRTSTPSSPSRGRFSRSSCRAASAATSRSSSATRPRSDLRPRPSDRIQDADTYPSCGLNSVRGRLYLWISRIRLLGGLVGAPRLPRLPAPHRDRRDRRDRFDSAQPKRRPSLLPLEAKLGGVARDVYRLYGIVAHHPGDSVADSRPALAVTAGRRRAVQRFPVRPAGRSALTASTLTAVDVHPERTSTDDVAPSTAGVLCSRPCGAGSGLARSCALLQDTGGPAGRAHRRDRGVHGRGRPGVARLPRSYRAECRDVRPGRPRLRLLHLRDALLPQRHGGSPRPPPPPAPPGARAPGGRGDDARPRGPRPRGPAPDGYPRARQALRTS